MIYTTQDAYVSTEEQSTEVKSASAMYRSYGPSYIALHLGRCGV